MRRSACSAGARVIASRRQTLCRGYGQRLALNNSRRALSFCPTSAESLRKSVAWTRQANSNVYRRKLGVGAFASAASVMKENGTQKTPVEKFRKDYEKVPYTVDDIHLTFRLGEETTTVESEMTMKALNVNGHKKDVYLNGRDDVVLKSICINGAEVEKSLYQVDGEGLKLSAEAVPDEDGWKMKIVTEIKPQDNSLLEGLYKSSGNFCSQCEAEGFRGITYFLDRPDVMAIYTTRIEAEKEKYPVLLSNGNLVESGDLEGGRHYAVWHDPFRKPCYLFALVAGSLSVQEDTFKTCSGKDVTLRIYVQPENIKKVDFAMESLKRSMKWDEDTFGLEYDLNIFNIVAVDDFNMGAMENKSLNLFNSRLVLATPDTATDGDFARIEGVVGHEYFHNWTGNRVTCRDWFQLTLKEGLTVYRDQEFSADMNSRPVQRVTDVIRLRSAQFTEDSGPMAHPVRPDSYIKMDNFYTVTVYEKGAEVVRLYETLLGKDGFRKGMDMYFQRHDGSAVTCDDFLNAMADANGEDLSTVSRWYGQAGTPTVTVEPSYDSSSKTYTLKCTQTIPATPGQDHKVPVMIPIKTALLGPDGSLMQLRLQGSSDSPKTEVVLRLTEESQTFVFEGVEAEPVPSLLRGFSAPVKMEIVGQTDQNLEFILANDTDPFNRWEAGQILARKLIISLYDAAISRKDGELVEDAARNAGGVSSNLVEAFKSVLKDTTLDGQFKALATGLPALTELVGAISAADPVVVHQVRSFVIKELASRLRPELEAALKDNEDAPGTPYVFSAQACARRALKNRAVMYLASLKDDAITEATFQRLKEATNMTDEISALAALDIAGGPLRDEAMSLFFEKWKHEPLVLLKWFTLQAESNQEGNIATMEKLINHPSFNIKNPNNCYSLFGGFSRSAVNFHSPDGSGYKFLADAILKLDGINHQVAARLVAPFTSFKRFDEARQALMRKELERIVSKEGLSANVYEIVSKSLN